MRLRFIIVLQHTQKRRPGQTYKFPDSCSSFAKWFSSDVRRLNEKIFVGLAKHPTREKLIYEQELLLSKVMMLMDDDVSLFIKICMSQVTIPTSKAQFRWSSRIFMGSKEFFSWRLAIVDVRENLKIPSELLASTASRSQCSTQSRLMISEKKTSLVNI